MTAIVIAVVVMLAIGAATAAAVRKLGEERESAVLLGAMAAISCAGVTVVWFFVSLGECLGENGDVPEAGSPRRQYCDWGSLESLGGLAFILLPAVAIIVGTVLRRRDHLVPSLLVYALVPFALAGPALYLDSLSAEAPPKGSEGRVFYDPVLRPAKGDMGPRVCMVYGRREYDPATVDPTEDPFAERTCVDLEPTDEARALTNEYDGGTTLGELERLAEDLSDDAPDVEEGDTSLDGISITAVHQMTLGEAGARKVGANGPILFDSEVVAIRRRVARRLRRAVALMDACGRARGSYPPCQDPVSRRVTPIWGPKGPPKNPHRIITVGITTYEDLPHQYDIRVEGSYARASALRARDTPRNGPPVFECTEGMPCDIAG